VEAEKARGLELVCKELGVAPEEVIAMGDSESDLEMIQMAGLGVAMGNSPDGVKKAALHIAPTNDEDGVAWAVRQFVL
jgi:hydroxymethylpyrimidine pyrophosphatase-like HAD family hydrolase